MDITNLDVAEILIPDVRVTAVYDGELLDLLRDSLKAMGQVQPLVVMQVDGKYYLIDGMHRLQEAQARGDKEIPSVVYEGDEADVYLKNLVLNRLRGKTKASEMVKVIGHLTGEYQLDSEAIKERTGLSRDYIEKLQVIYLAGGHLLEALDEELLGLGHAFLIARIPGQAVRDNVLAQQLTYQWKVKDLEEYIKTVLGILQERPESPAAAAPREEGLARCQYCGGSYPVLQVASPVTCIGCSSILHDTIRGAVAEAKRSAASEDE